MLRDDQKRPKDQGTLLNNKGSKKYINELGHCYSHERQVLLTTKNAIKKQKTCSLQKNYPQGFQISLCICMSWAQGLRTHQRYFKSKL